MELQCDFGSAWNFPTLTDSEVGFRNVASWNVCSELVSKKSCKLSILSPSKHTLQELSMQQKKKKHY